MKIRYILVQLLLYKIVVIWLFMSMSRISREILPQKRRMRIWITYIRLVKIIDIILYLSVDLNRKNDLLCRIHLNQLLWKVSTRQGVIINIMVLEVIYEAIRIQVLLAFETFVLNRMLLLDRRWLGNSIWTWFGSLKIWVLKI